MKVVPGLMVALGYGKFFRSEKIVGLEPLEEGRGPGQRTRVWLLLDSRVLCNQQLNERRQQRFASLADVVHKLEETQVEREFLL